MDALGQDAGSGVELPRGDLASILYEAGRADAEYVFNDSIRALDQEDRGVDVTFERAAPRRFDLVVGADGLHSRVRRLVFGAERDHIRYLGLYVATLPLDAPPTTNTRSSPTTPPAGPSSSTPHPAKRWPR